jgi:pimeloyl-ACP methyl ester carboxylesterase
MPISVNNRVSKDEYPFTPRQKTIGGHELSYIDEGQGPVVVMLHGNPTWSFFYRRLILALRDTYRVIAPDHLGCGMSAKPHDYPYRLRDHITNIEGLLDALGINRFSLIMHDWGGAIGMGVAGGRPEQVQTLVVMNTAAFPSLRIPLRIRICRTPVIGDILIRGLNVFARAALTMAVKRPLVPPVAAGYLAPYDSWANRIGILRFVQDIPLSSKDASWETLIGIEKTLCKFVRTPMLLLWGGRDFCFNHDFFVEWRYRFPQAECRYFADAGHYLLEDAFADIAPLTVDFFKRNLKQATGNG